MASPTALVAWNKAIFFALLLLAFNVSARELARTSNVVARMTYEMTKETNGVMGSRLIARQLDSSWKGNYYPPRRLIPPPCSSSGGNYNRLPLRCPPPPPFSS